jgi:hypothetical protein
MNLTVSGEVHIVAGPVHMNVPGERIIDLLVEDDDMLTHLGFPGRDHRDHDHDQDKDQDLEDHKFKNINLTISGLLHVDTADDEQKCNVMKASSQHESRPPTEETGNTGPVHTEIHAARITDKLVGLFQNDNLTHVGLSELNESQRCQTTSPLPWQIKVLTLQSRQKQTPYNAIVVQPPAASHSETCHA